MTLPAEAGAKGRSGGDGPWFEEGLRQFVQSFLLALESTHGLLTVTLPAPVVRFAPLLEALADAAGHPAGSQVERQARPTLPSPSLVWKPPAGAWFVGQGETAVLRLEGDAPAALLQQETEKLRSRWMRMAAPGCELPPARLFGGLAFQPADSAPPLGGDEPPWQTLGDGRFVLPRWLYAADAEVATLSLTLDGADPGLTQLLPLALEQLSLWWGALGRAVLATDGSGEARQTAGHLEIPRAAQAAPEVLQLEESCWVAQVEAVREGIRQGRFRKVVLARRAEVRAQTAFSLTSLLCTLAHDFPTCTVFAFQAAGEDAASLPVTFLGATPERLVRRTGARVTTEALAGSSLSTFTEDEAALLASLKDQEEHRIVVEQIREALQPYCTSIRVEDPPRIRRLRNVLHLQTPIEATLRQDSPGAAHVLELVQALHPTPAVGGVPTRDALPFLRQLEGHTRGWYAGPIGWCDLAGEGEFWVALRSGLVAGERAWLYAGAGIMRDSDPHLEYLETGLKQRALLSALLETT